MGGLVTAEGMKAMLTDYPVQHIAKDGTKTFHPLVEPLAEDDKRREFLEGSAFDLTLGKVHMPYADTGIPSMGIEDMVGAQTCEIEPDKDGWYEFRKGDVALLETAETVTIPMTMVELIRRRTRIFRNFNKLEFSDGHPNYRGPIVGLLTVHHPAGFRIQRGARFCYFRLIEFQGMEVVSLADVDIYQDGMWGEEGFTVNTQGEKVRAY